ncbi:hypothetical protein Dsin_024239 [Dipteronia sinensis]|uniref:Uncharacterized protein n=1 Tax=Dipteronia sinensis TaxID=43782 RepID=A0AAD9ZUQ8_9ROSI|nr:hypothetical protein Dsin_024239 [Dipteronia sinensis]
MEIHIASREMIKPSSPTPNHLRSHKMSPMDLIVRDSYFSFAIFYSSGSTTSSHHLKKSLSKTLTDYYPFAGRLNKDHNLSSVDSDDYGVTFVEARVAGDIFGLLKSAELEPMVKRLRAYNPDQMLSAQANYFDCGGVAIIVSFRHVIADATAAANFLKNWSIDYCGGNSNIKDFVSDFTTIFPDQQNSSPLSKIDSQAIDDLSEEAISKRFVLDDCKVAALREKVGNQATRFEAVLALIWGAMINSTEEEDQESNSQQFATIFPINLRKKINPPLPEQCIGSVCTLGMTFWPTMETVDHSKTASKVHGLIGLVDEYATKGFENGWKNLIMDYSGIDSKCKTRAISVISYLRLPFYEADFGSGKPIWVSISNDLMKDTVGLLDTCDGQGVEVWVRLSKEQMIRFQQDPAILAYASFNPTLQSSSSS